MNSYPRARSLPTGSKEAGSKIDFEIMKYLLVFDTRAPHIVKSLSIFCGMQQCIDVYEYTRMRQNPIRSFIFGWRMGSSDQNNKYFVIFSLCIADFVFSWHITTKVPFEGLHFFLKLGQHRRQKKFFCCFQIWKNIFLKSTPDKRYIFTQKTFYLGIWAF